MKSTKRLAISLAVAVCALFTLAGTAMAAPPANDDFAQASVLMNGVLSSGSNAESTIESGEDGIFPAWGLFNSVWFTYTPTRDGTIAFSSCSTFVSNLIVLKGSSIATAQLAVSSPATAHQSVATACGIGANLNDITRFDVTAGVPLQIHYGSAFAGLTGNYAIAASYIPEMTNNNFADATVLTDGVAVDDLNYDANGEADEEVVEAVGGRSFPQASKGVWYKLNTTTAGKLNVSACPRDGFDGVVDVFSGSTMSSLVLQNWADSSPCDTVAPLYYTGAQEIYIRVSGYNGAVGGFTLTATFDESSPNDNFADAQLLTGDTPTATWSNANAGTEFGEPNPSNAGSTLWYKWTPATDGFATFSACPVSFFDNVVGVFTGTSVNALSLVGSADGGCANGGGRTSALAVTGGTTYYVQVSGYGGVTGTSPVLIEYEGTPVNETVATATDLGSATGVHITADNRYASDTAESGEPFFKGQQRFKSVWFKWTSPLTGEVNFNACGNTSGSDGMIGVFSNNIAPAAPAPGDLVPLAGGSGDGDDNCSPSNGMGTMIRNVTSGTTYWIGIANYSSGATGRDFDLNISVAPVNTSPPVVSGADTFVGTELTALNGDWAGEAPITYTYQWDSCPGGGECNPIAGADQSTYTLTAGEVGSGVRVRVTANNPSGAATASSTQTSIVDLDDDSDGVGNASDSCPDNAQGPGKSNGCPVEEISILTAPGVTGTAQVGSSLILSLGSAENTPGLDSGVGAPTSEIHWYSCSSATIIGSCATRSGSTTNYVPAANDVGRFIRAEVVWTNSDASSGSQYSVATAAVAAAPVVDPPTGGGDTTPPPPAVNPLTLTVKTSLGKLTPKKGSITITAAVAGCAASATGPCTGTIEFSTTKNKKTKTFFKTKISIAPGKSGPITFKLSSSALKAIKKAKKVKAAVKFSIAAPGFAPSTATASATLLPQKK